MLLERSISGPIHRPVGGLGLGNWPEVILGLVYPPVCALCHQHRADRDQGYVCTACQGSVRRITEPCCQRCGIPFSGTIIGSQTCAACRRDSWAWDEARAAAIAEGITLECIHRLKYQRELWFGTFLSGLMMEAALPRLVDHSWQGVVPVPLHRVKQREREFNQAERLAAPLAHALGGALENGSGPTMRGHVEPNFPEPRRSDFQHEDRVRTGPFPSNPRIMDHRG